MIEFNAKYQQYQLVIAPAVYERLLLFDQDNRPLTIVHPDPALLKDLESEIMDRFQAREGAVVRRKKADRWQEIISIPLLIGLFISSQYYAPLARRLHISVLLLGFSVAGVALLLYSLVNRLTGSHRTESPGDALEQDLRLNAWIRENCHPPS